MEIYDFTKKRKKDIEQGYSRKNHNASRYLAFAGAASVHKADESLEFHDSVLGSSGHMYFGSIEDMNHLENKIRQTLNEVAIGNDFPYNDPSYYCRWNYDGKSLLMFNHDDFGQEMNHIIASQENIFMTEFGEATNDDSITFVLLKMDDYASDWKIGKEPFDLTNAVHIKMHEQFLLMVIRIYHIYASSCAMVAEFNRLDLIREIVKIIHEEKDSAALEDISMTHCVVSAFENGYNDIVLFLLHEQNLPQSIHMEAYFEKYPKLKNMFYNRSVKDTLINQSYNGKSEI